MIRMENQSWRLHPGLQGKLQRWWKYGEIKKQSWSVTCRSPGCFWSLPLQTLWRVAGKSSATAWRRWGFGILISNKPIFDPEFTCLDIVELKIFSKTSSLDIIEFKFFSKTLNPDSGGVNFLKSTRKNIHFPDLKIVNIKDIMLKFL